MKLAGENFARYLEFRTDLESPTRFDVALIGAFMLFPDDDVWLARAMQSSCVEYFSQESASLDSDSIRGLQGLTRHADPIETVQEEVKKSRFAHGMIAGEVLHNVIVSNALDLKPKTISAITRDAFSRFKPPRFRVGMNTFNNVVWPRFRPVAHFWAASFKHVKIDGVRPFPCDVTRFREFLADAEWYRLAGEATRPPRSPNPVLRRSEAFTLPPKLHVEPSALVPEFSPAIDFSKSE